MYVEHVALAFFHITTGHCTLFTCAYMENLLFLLPAKELHTFVSCNRKFVRTYVGPGGGFVGFTSQELQFMPPFIYIF